VSENRRGNDYEEEEIEKTLAMEVGE